MPRTSESSLWPACVAPSLALAAGSWCCVSTEPAPSAPLPVCAAPAAGTSPEDAVVRVIGDLGLPGFTLCSGVLIAPRLVLTHLHCVLLPSQIDPSELIPRPLDRPDFGEDLHPWEYTESCVTDAGWGLREDGSFVARLAQPLEPWRLTAAVRRGDTDQQVSAVRRLLLPNAESRCWDAIAALVLEQPLAGHYLPVRLQDSTRVGEPVTVAGFGESSAAPHALRTHVEDVAYEAATEVTPPRSMTLADQICYYEIGGPLTSDLDGALIGVIAHGTGSYCGDPTGATVVTKVAPFRRMLLEAAEASTSLLRTIDLPAPGGALPPCP